MTYEELALKISEMTAKQKNADLTLYIEGADEFYPLRSLDFAIGDDRIDGGHPYFTL